MVTLGTATPGGGFPVYGQAVAETVNEDRSVARGEDAQYQGLDGERAHCSRRASSTWRLVQGEVAHEAFAASAVRLPGS